MMSLKSYDDYTNSNISIIGEIPSHWRIEKLKHISNVKPSNVDKKSKNNEPHILLCNYTDVYNNEFITMELDFMKATASYEQIRKLSLNVGDIIITRDSESADDIAVPAIVTKKLNNVVCGYHLAVIKPDTNFIHPKFLFRTFESGQINKQFELCANGVTRFGLGTYPINNAYVYLPPLDEQIQIANYLDKETSRIDKTIMMDEQLIQLLEEKRTRLINHVVTNGLNPNVPLKNSGVDWIGEIPKHWEVAFLKRFVFSVSSGKTNKIDENGKYPLYGSTGIIGSTNDMDYNGTYILIARVGANAGKTHIAKGKMGITDNTLIVKYNSKINYKFLFYILSTYDFKTLTIGSGQPLITGNDVKNIKICIPDLNEQKHIVNYLDTEISNIENIIFKIKEKINLLKEYKHSMIDHIVAGKIDVRGENI